MSWPRGRSNGIPFRSGNGFSRIQKTPENPSKIDPLFCIERRGYSESPLTTGTGIIGNGSGGGRQA